MFKSSSLELYTDLVNVLNLRNFSATFGFVRGTSSATQDFGADSAIKTVSSITDACSAESWAARLLGPARGTPSPAEKIPCGRCRRALALVAGRSVVRSRGARQLAAPGGDGGSGQTGTGAMVRPIHSLPPRRRACTQSRIPRHSLQFTRSRRTSSWALNSTVPRGSGKQSISASVLHLNQPLSIAGSASWSSLPDMLRRARTGRGASHPRTLRAPRSTWRVTVRDARWRGRSARCVRTHRRCALCPLLCRLLSHEGGGGPPGVQTVSVRSENLQP